MDKFITHLLLVSMETHKDFRLTICKMADQQMAVTLLYSMKMGAINMLTQRRQKLMFQDGNTFQDR